MAEWETAGKVRMTPKGVWSSGTAYNILDMVSNTNKTAYYVAKQDVPAGTSLTNTAYWEPITDISTTVSNLENEINRLQDITTLAYPEKEVRGSVCSANGTINAGLVDMKLYGKCVYSTGTGKNLVPPVDFETRTDNGVTYIRNADNTLTVNGTASSNSSAYSRPFTLPPGEYILSGCPSGGTNGTYNLFIWDYTANSRPEGHTTSMNDVGNGLTFTITNDEGHEYIAQFRVLSGVSVSNLLVKPMIRLSSVADATYEPYTGGVASPNPDYPIDIETSGDDGTIELRSYGKNMYNGNPQNEYNTTINGITFSYKADGSGSVVVNGTASAETMCVSVDFYLPAGQYIFTGCPSGGSQSTYHQFIWDATTNSRPEGHTANMNETGSGLAFTLLHSHIYRVYTRIANGATARNVIFYPMIRRVGIGDAEFELTKITNAVLPITDGVRGIRVSSDGNYTDTEGQQWLCDEIDFANRKHIQRLVKYTIDNNTTESVLNTPTARTNTVRVTLNLKTGASNSRSNVVCNVLPYNNSIWNIDEIGCFTGTENDLIAISIPISVGTSKADILSWLQNNNATFIKPRAVPVYADLTSEQISALEQLKTQKGSTNIFTTDDTQPEMCVKMNIDIPTYIDENITN